MYYAFAADIPDGPIGGWAGASDAVPHTRDGTGCHTAWREDYLSIVCKSTAN